MAEPLEMLTTVLKSTLSPCMRAHGVTAHPASFAKTSGGFVSAQVRVEHPESRVAGTLSVTVVPSAFPDGGPQWAVFVCRIVVEGRPPLDRACIYTGGDRLRHDFGEMLTAFLTAPTSPPPSLRRSTVVLQ